MVLNEYCQFLSVLIMSEDQLKAFLEAVKDDAGLQEKLNSAADPDAVVEIAKDAGFMISAEELQRAQAEVSEEELENVAGGGTGTGQWKCGWHF
jgi:predicted ribosomally synthesized peptide with nif11-like leader